MGNNKIIEELEIQAPKDSATPNNMIEKGKYDFYDKEAPND